MKKTLVIILTIVMIFSLTSCFEAEKKETRRVKEILYDTADTPDKLTEKTNLKMEAPEGAKKISYEYMYSVGEDNEYEPTARVRFTYKGGRFWFIETKRYKINFDSNKDKDATVEDLNKSIEEPIDRAAQLCGYNYKWGSLASIDLESGPEAVVAFNEGYAGVIAWWDKKSGIFYCVCTDENSNQEMLMEIAEACCATGSGDSK